MTNQYLTRTVTTRDPHITEAMIEAARQELAIIQQEIDALPKRVRWTHEPDRLTPLRNKHGQIERRIARLLATHERQQREIADGTLVPETEATDD